MYLFVPQSRGTLHAAHLQALCTIPYSLLHVYRDQSYVGVSEMSSKDYLIQKHKHWIRHATSNIQEHMITN